MSLLEEALLKARKEAKSFTPGDFLSMPDPKNILTSPRPQKKPFFIWIGVSLCFFIAICLALFFLFWNPTKYELQSNDQARTFSNSQLPSLPRKKDLSITSMKETIPELNLKTPSPSPQKLITQEPELQKSTPKEEKVVFNYLLLEVNGIKHQLKNGEHLKVARGDVIKIIDADVDGTPTNEIRVKFLGFVGDKLNNIGADRGYFIDTAKDLWEKYSQDRKGNNYTITINNGKTRIGTVYLDIAEPKKDLSSLNEITKTKKQVNQIESLLKNAYTYSQAGNLAKAIQCYNKILSFDPKQFEALLNRGIIKQKMGNNEEAEKDLLRAQNINPDDPILLNALGVLYLKKGDEKRAEDFLLKAGDATAKINLALHYWDKGEYKKVISFLKDAEREDKQNPYIPYYLGLFYRQIGDYTSAQDQLEKAVSIARKRGLTDLIHNIESIYIGE
jgi:tetratricopeptide (TPR) repeat protein